MLCYTDILNKVHDIAFTRADSCLLLLDQMVQYGIEGTLYIFPINPYVYI